MDTRRQICPYTAFVWNWACTAAYTWSVSGHNNELERVAAFNAVRSRSSTASFHRPMFCRVFGSHVVRCVTARGRSSSRQLNRIARRVAAVLLACDNDPVALWTMSTWNYAGGGSSLFSHHAADS